MMPEYERRKEKVNEPPRRIKDVTTYAKGFE